jgi:non-specific serine/threonine protein kinase
MATARLPEPSRSPRTRTADDPLTPREREIAGLIARGMTNREIAAALFVGERTVESHVGNTFQKLGFSSRSQIAAWASEHGLLPPGT